MTSSDMTSLPNNIFVLLTTFRERFLILLYADQVVHVSCIVALNDSLNQIDNVIKTCNDVIIKFDPFYTSKKGHSRWAVLPTLLAFNIIIKN